MENRIEATSDAATAVLLTADLEDLEDRTHDVETALQDLSSVYDNMIVIRRFQGDLEHLNDERRKMGKDAMDTEVCKVEVLWQGRIELYSFQIPRESRYLSAATKQSFKMTVDFRTASKRMESLLVKSTPKFILEMKRICFLCDRSPLYALMHAIIEPFKWMLYVFAVLLNLNLLMNTYGEKKLKKHPDFNRGYNKLMEAAFTPETSGCPFTSPFSWRLASSRATRCSFGF